MKASTNTVPFISFTFCCKRELINVLIPLKLPLALISHWSVKSIV